MKSSNPAVMDTDTNKPAISSAMAVLSVMSDVTPVPLGRFSRKASISF